MRFWPYWVLSGSVRNSVVKNWPSVWLPELHRTVFRPLLMGEGFLLITIAYIPALVVAYNLGISDLVETWPVEWSFTRFLIGGLVTFLLLLTIAAISIWFPARQAMSIQPAEALHGE